MTVNVLDGCLGGVIISNTTATKGSWSAIQVISDAVFTLLTGNVTGYASVTIPAGTVLFGRFSAITLASGTVLAYTRPTNDKR
jgi:hypothetical protein